MSQSPEVKSLSPDAQEGGSDLHQVSPSSAPSPSAPTEKRDEEDITVSVSTVFYPSHDAGTGRPDVTVVSADYVYFYAHAEKLLQQSGNRFNALLPPDMTHISHEQPMLVHVPEEATVLNIVLHAIYGWSSSSFGHSVDQIRLAVNSLEKYGVSLEECLSPDSPLRSLILSHAQLRPIEMYAMAAAHHLESLAVSVSSMLLSYPLLSLTDELAIQMGAAYLRRLVLLHEKRMDLLRGLVLAPPDTHRTTNTCTFEQQKDLTSAWALTVAELAWQASPDLPTTHLQKTLGGIESQFACMLCKDTLQAHTKQILYEWTVAERTI